MRHRDTVLMPKLLAAAALGLASLLAVAPAQAQSIRCQPGFGPAQPEDRCNDATLDARNPLPDGYLAIALSRNMVAGAGADADQALAQRKAIAACTQQGGDGCKVAATHFNACASLAGSAPEKLVAQTVLMGAGWNASEMAMAKCRQSGGHSCHPLVTACYNGYVSPRPYLPSERRSTYEAPVLRRSRQ